MARKHSQLRLVGAHDPASVFDGLDALRRAQTATATPAFQGTRRQRSVETFARIPHDRARRLYHLSGSAWALLIELDRLILEGRGRNPVRLTTITLKASGLSEKRKRSGLDELETAGMITVERQRGRSPLVTHLWFATSP
jgi:hypothetical protein